MGDTAGEVAVEVDIEVDLHRGVGEGGANFVDSTFVDAGILEGDGSIC